MAKSIKKTIFLTLPIALGVFLIWYSVSKFTPQDIDSIKTSFKTANYWWVALSLFLGVLSHLSRAYRWNYLLEPMGYKPKLLNNVMTVLIAYLLNLVVPRSGEFARAAGIRKYENIPFEKAIGTIFAERVADMVMLLLIIAISFYYQADLIGSYIFKESNQSNTIFKLIILLLFPVVGFLSYKLLQKSKYPFFVKIIKLVNGLFDGLKSIFTMEKKWEFLFHTLFIWVMYLLMFYVVIFALPETSNLPFSAIIVGFVVGSLSMALTNGGLGSYPVFVASALILYNVDQNPARAFGWIMWTSQTLMIVLFGGLSFILIPFYNKKRN